MEFFFGIFENDPNSKLPQLEDEKAELEECLRSLQISGQMAISLDTNIGLRTLLDKLRDYQNVITIFHFSGHHAIDYIKTNDSELDDEDLITFLNNCPKLKLVVINGCSSEPILERLVNVPIKIGTTEDVYDIYAKEFAVQLYKNIFSGDSIDGIKDRQKILESFKISTGTSYNLLSDNDKEGASEKRGGGNSEKLKSETFKISTSADDDGQIFEKRNAKTFDKENVKMNEDFEIFLDKKLGDQSIKGKLGLQQAYQIYRHYPFNISFFLKKILSHDQEANGFNVMRFNATKELFKEYFNLIRVVSMAAIWDSFSQNRPNEQENQFISKVLQTYHSDLSLEDYHESLHLMIDFLPVDYKNSKNNIDDIFKNFKDEREFLIGAIKVLDKSPEHNGGAQEYHKIYKSSILVQGFIRRFGILRSLSFCSITRINFMNYKKIHNKIFTFKTHTFPIFSRPDTSSSDELIVKGVENSENGTLDESKLDIKDQNSVYLLFEENERSSYLLNLSPFLFDANTENANAEQVDFNYTVFYDNRSKDWGFTKTTDSSKLQWIKSLDNQEEKPSLIIEELKFIVELFFDKT